MAALVQAPAPAAPAASAPATPSVVPRPFDLQGAVTQPMFPGPPSVPSSSGAQQSPPSSSAAPSPAKPVARSGPSSLPAGHHAIRVAVSPVDGSGELHVRPLAPGEAPPPGARVAVLVALEPGTSLYG
jgi:hypothetical protein